jgi:hypothetical protein
MRAMAENLAKRMILSLSVLVSMVGLSGEAVAQSQGGTPQFKPAPPAATAPPAKKAVAPAPTVVAPAPPVPPAPPTPAAKTTPPAPPVPPTPPGPAAPPANQSLPAPSVAYPPPPATTTSDVPAPPPPGSVPPPGTPVAPPGAAPQPGAPPLCCPCYPGAPAGAYPGYPGAAYSPYGPGAYPPTMVAPYNVPDPGHQKHDGFYLRVGLGIGAAGLTRQSSTTKTELSGAVSSFSLILGGALTQNLILYGELFSQSATSNPKLVIDGVDRGGQSNADFTLFGIGPGAAYYFTTTNIHVSATVALSGLAFRNLFAERPTESSGTGASLKLGVGKDWWVSSNWALGASAQLVVGSVKDLDSKDVVPGDENPSWDIASFSVLLSGTYN